MIEIVSVVMMLQNWLCGFSDRQDLDASISDTKKTMMTDQQLLTLIESICVDAISNLEGQRIATDRLLRQLQRLPGLFRSAHPDYLEALNRTWEWVSRSICTFRPRAHLSPQESLVKWVNSYLYWRIRDLPGVEVPGQSRLDRLISKDTGDKTTQLDQLADTPFGMPTLNSLDAYLEGHQQQKIEQIVLSLEHYIELDPDKLLQDCHPRKHPECNCQVLSQRVLLKYPPDRFADISRDLGVNYQTLKSHWEKKCKPLLQKIVADLGYSGRN